MASNKNIARYLGTEPANRLRKLPGVVSPPGSLRSRFAGSCQLWLLLGRPRDLADFAELARQLLE